LVLSVAHHQPAQAQAQTLSREMQAAAMVGSYLGMADFCAAYGIDFRPLAHQVRDGFRVNAMPDTGDPNRMIFDDSVQQGTRGILYSLQTGQFVDVPASGADMRMVCQSAHQQVVRISQMK
jgi:hypothetical protein